MSHLRPTKILLTLWSFGLILLCLAPHTEVQANGYQKTRRGQQQRAPGEGDSQPAGKEGGTQEGAGEKKEEETPGEPEVVVTGNLGAVRYSPLLLDNLPFLEKNNKNVVCFSVRSMLAPVSGAKVAATGLGDVEFGLLDAGSKCPSRPSQGVATLALPELKPDADTRVWMRFPENVIGNTGDSIEGNILILEPKKKNLEVPLKIQSPTWSSLFTALLWGIGVIIPAGIGLLSVYLGNIWFGVWQERRAERGKLEAFITDKYPALQVLFKDHLPTVMGNEDKVFSENISTALDARGIMEVIPAAEREKLRAAIARCQRDQIRKLLAKLFPDWKENIKGTARVATVELGTKQQPPRDKEPPPEAEQLQNLMNEGNRDE